MPILPIPLRWAFSHPRGFAWAFWGLVLTAQLVGNSLVTASELQSAGRNYQPWEPWLWELTSVALVAPLIAMVQAWEQRFPLQHPHWRIHLAWHVLGSGVFCTVHVVGMRVLRNLAYGALDAPYLPAPWWSMWRYEYLKDLRAYTLIVLTVVTYRWWRLRLQGEARLLDSPDPPHETPAPAAEPVVPPHAPPTPAFPERFLVRKLQREFLIAPSDIAWVQAQANYVALHVHGHEYLLRSTLADFERQLDPALFVRVHRSHLVQRNAINHIEPLDSGDALLHLRNGARVPCTRRYRAGLVGPPSTNPTDKDKGT